MQQPSDEIKSRLDIVDILRDYINIQAAGINFRALCPFHREKSPSFMVSPEKQIWHCFGCGKGGDLISFVMEIEGVSFVEALRILAPKAGITLQKQDPKVISKRNKLLDAVEAARNYYHEILLDSPQAESARNYLKDRGINNETISDWQIGYAPDDWEDLIRLLKSKGFKDDEIFSAGLSVKKEGTNRFYNRFRGRVIFPINDVNANIVGFSARVSPEKEKTEVMGKYINSPQTLIYDKSKILFGLDKAKMAIKNEGFSILVEGQMDVITAHQQGFKNVVAASGTALTKEHINLLKRYSANVSLAFDADEAGRMAADRGVREAMAGEMNIKIIKLPAGKDPDDLIKESPEDWKSLVEGARPVMEYYFTEIFSSLNVENVESKRLAAHKALNIISKLENKIEKDHWLRKLSEKIDISESVLRETLNSVKKTVYQKPIEDIKIEEKKSLSREELLSEALISLIIKFPALINYLENNISSDNITGDNNKFLYNNLIIYYNSKIQENIEEAGVDYSKFKDFLSSSVSNKSGEALSSQLKLLNKLVILSDKDFYDFDLPKAKNEVIKIVLILKRVYLSNRMREVEKLIINFEADGKNKESEVLMEELKNLSEELNNLKS